jgi:hypothetical protein
LSWKELVEEEPRTHQMLGTCMVVRSQP